MAIALRPCSLGEDVEVSLTFARRRRFLALVFHSPYCAAFIGRPACGALDAPLSLFSIIDIRSLDG